MLDFYAESSLIAEALTSPALEKCLPSELAYLDPDSKPVLILGIFEMKGSLVSAYSV